MFTESNVGEAKQVVGGVPTGWGSNGLLEPPKDLF
jgi:hypothetical protein